MHLYGRTERPPRRVGEIILATGLQGTYVTQELTAKQDWFISARRCS
jgi:hypothetical protein